MSRAKELLDLSIRAAISGSDDPTANGISIEDDYLRRERDENRRESGLFVLRAPEERTEVEKAIWKSNKQLEELEDERWKRTEADEEAHLEKEFDERFQHTFIPRLVLKV